MKRGYAAGLVVAVAVLLTAVVAYACWNDYGTAYPMAGTDASQVAEFQSETLELRDALLAKRIELRNEYAKPVPDSKRVASLRKDIVDLQTQIRTVADKYGLSGGCCPMDGGTMVAGSMMDTCPMDW